MSVAKVTVVVPSFNQGAYISDALASITAQHQALELFVMDGGSTDQTLSELRRYEQSITYWRSCRDDGQAAAINEGIAMGCAPYVYWLNSDDYLLPGALDVLIEHLELNPNVPAVYGKVWNIHQASGRRSPIWVEPFSARRLAIRCIISQPGVLMRRSAWEAVNGLDTRLHLALDYDMWWRLYRFSGPLKFVDTFVAVNREHDQTKTQTMRRKHYQEAIQVVRKHAGYVPLKWWLAQPYAVWFRSFLG